MNLPRVAVVWGSSCEASTNRERTGLFTSWLGTAVPRRTAAADHPWGAPKGYSIKFSSLGYWGSKGIHYYKKFTLFVVRNVNRFRGFEHHLHLKTTPLPMQCPCILLKCFKVWLLLFWKSASSIKAFLIVRKIGRGRFKVFSVYSRKENNEVFFFPNMISDD